LDKLEEVGKRRRITGGRFFIFARAEKHERHQTYMTLIRPDGDDGTAADILAAVKEHLKDVALDIDRRRKSLQSKPDLDPGAMKKLMADYRTVTQNCFTEANRLEEQLKRNAGIVHEYAVDFDAARDEIRGRLARLRGAGSAGDVPE